MLTRLVTYSTRLTTFSMTVLLPPILKLHKKLGYIDIKKRREPIHARFLFDLSVHQYTNIPVFRKQNYRVQFCCSTCCTIKLRTLPCSCERCGLKEMTVRDLFRYIYIGSHITDQMRISLRHCLISDGACWQVE